MNLAKEQLAVLALFDYASGVPMRTALETYTIEARQMRALIDENKTLGAMFDTAMKQRSDHMFDLYQAMQSDH